MSLQAIYDVVGESDRLGQKVGGERYEMASVEAGKLLSIEKKENEAWKVGKWETEADSAQQTTWKGSTGIHWQSWVRIVV